MMGLCDKELNLKVERYLINQTLKKCSGLRKIIYQRPENRTGSNVIRQNSFRIKT